MAARMSRRGRVLTAGAAIAVTASLLGTFAARAATGATANSGTTTSVRVSPASVTVGGRVALSATLKSTTAKRPTGTVTFKVGSTRLCAAKLSGAAARCSAKITVAGRVTVTAGYGGDAGHAASSGSARVTVARAPSALTVGVSPQIVALGAAAVLSVRVTSRFGVPSGTVTFADAKGALCAVKLAKGAAACHRVFAALGTYRITARYGGDATRAKSSASAKLIVAQGETATSVSVSAAAAPAEAATTFSASVSTPDGTPTGAVVFAIGAAELCTGTLTDGTASCKASYPTPGKYTVTATYAGDDSFYGSFGLLSWTVTTIPTALTVAGSPSAVPQGTAATVTASIAPAAATGTVTFSQGGTVICAATPLADGSASCITPDLLTLGTGQITAAYAGTALYAPSSGALTLNVVRAVTSVTACVNVGSVGKRGNVGVTLTLITPGGDTTAQPVGGGFWFAGRSNCPGNFFRSSPWTLTFAQPVALSELTNPASYLQVASTTQSAWHGQFELFTGVGGAQQQILLTRPNMYYNEKSAADPCGDDESVNTYQFPLTSTPPGTCGTPAGLNS
jgi:hypothetical protein